MILAIDIIPFWILSNYIEFFHTFRCTSCRAYRDCDCICRSVYYFSRVSYSVARAGRQKYRYLQIFKRLSNFPIKYKIDNTHLSFRYVNIPNILSFARKRYLDQLVFFSRPTCLFRKQSGTWKTEILRLYPTKY